MIADFYKSIQKNNSERVLPAKVVKSLNDQLPKGYHYVRNKEGKYIIEPMKGKSSQHFTCSFDRKKNEIPDEINEDQIFEYIYRTQKPIQIDSITISEDGKELGLNDFGRDPITGDRTEILQNIVLYPKPFPPAVPMKFATSDGEIVEIYFRRMPYASMEHVKYENITLTALKMEWLIPEKKPKKELAQGKIKIEAKPYKASTVNDARLSLKILKDCLKSRLKINNTLIRGNITSNTNKLDNGELDGQISLWEKFQNLENILNISFNPSAGLPAEDQTFAAELFYNFLDKKEFIYTQPFTHFSIVIDPVYEKNNQLDELIGKSNVPLSVMEKFEANLMGATFTLYRVNVLIDMIVERIIPDYDRKEAEIYISDAPNAKFKVIKKYYITEEEAFVGMNEISNQYSTR